MKLNQRKNNNEQGEKQRELRSTVLQKYKNHIEHVIQDSEISFDSIETPGWTSLVNTEQSKFTNHYHQKKKQPNQDTHVQILNRLKSLPKLNNKFNSYNNIRINPSSVKNKNLFVYNSVKISQKNQTPRSKLSEKESLHSKKSFKNEKNANSLKKNQIQSSPNKFLNRFNKSKPNIFFSVERPSDQRLKSSHKRVQSVRSQPSQNLKEKIQQRLSMGNYIQKPRDSELQRNIYTEPNQETITQRNYDQKNNFYSLNNQQKASKDQKNEYFNRYMSKLSLRNKNQNKVKIFKKSNFTQVSNKQNKNTAKMDLIKEKQNTSKRFNAITVHDHLYQEHIKLESKKQIQRMIEDSYKKATNFTFTPYVSQKSTFLADSKFERESNGLKKQGHQRHSLTNCFKKTEKKMNKPLKQSVYTVQEQISMKQKQKMSEMIQRRTLLRLFAFLSNNTQEINEDTVEINIMKLPLSLIEFIEPLLTRIYKKQRFSQKQFLYIFQSKGKQSKQEKQMNSHRTVIINQIEKFFKSYESKKVDSSQKSIKKQNELNFIR